MGRPINRTLRKIRHGIIECEEIKELAQLKIDALEIIIKATNKKLELLKQEKLKIN